MKVSGHRLSMKQPAGRSGSEHQSRGGASSGDGAPGPSPHTTTPSTVTVLYGAAPQSQEQRECEYRHCPPSSSLAPAVSIYVMGRPPPREGRLPYSSYHLASHQQGGAPKGASSPPPPPPSPGCYSSSLPEVGRRVAQWLTHQAPLPSSSLPIDSSRSRHHLLQNHEPPTGEGGAPPAALGAGAAKKGRTLEQQTQGVVEVLSFSLGFRREESQPVGPLLGGSLLWAGLDALWSSPSSIAASATASTPAPSPVPLIQVALSFVHVSGTFCDGRDRGGEPQKDEVRLVDLLSGKETRQQREGVPPGGGRAQLSKEESTSGGGGVFAVRPTDISSVLYVTVTNPEDARIVAASAASRLVVPPHTSDSHHRCPGEEGEGCVLCTVLVSRPLLAGVSGNGGGEMVGVWRAWDCLSCPRSSKSCCSCCPSPTSARTTTTAADRRLPFPVRVVRASHASAHVTLLSEEGEGVAGSGTADRDGTSATAITAMRHLITNYWLREESDDGHDSRYHVPQHTARATPTAALRRDNQRAVALVFQRYALSFTAFREAMMSAAATAGAAPVAPSTATTTTAIVPQPSRASPAAGTAAGVNNGASSSREAVLKRVKKPAAPMGCADDGVMGLDDLQAEVERVEQWMRSMRVQPPSRTPPLSSSGAGATSGTATLTTSAIIAAAVSAERKRSVSHGTRKDPPSPPRPFTKLPAGVKSSASSSDGEESDNDELERVGVPEQRSGTASPSPPPVPSSSSSLPARFYIREAERGGEAHCQQNRPPPMLSDSEATTLLSLLERACD